MAEQVKAEADVLDTAVTTVDNHRTNQNTIAMRVKSTADERQASWIRQGTTAVTQVIMQFMEEHRQIDQALLGLSDGLRSADTTLTSTGSEVATEARRLNSEAASNYRNLP